MPAFSEQIMSTVSGIVAVMAVVAGYLRPTRRRRSKCVANSWLRVVIVGCESTRLPTRPRARLRVHGHEHNVRA